MIELKFMRLSSEAVTPERGTEDSACFDLFALEDVEFEPNEVKLVNTGWACEAPKGYRVNIYVRSSTPLKKGFMLANGVGIVDNDYRGELMIQLYNIKAEIRQYEDVGGYKFNVGHSAANKVCKGDKVAQIELVYDVGYKHEVEAVFVDGLSETGRGTGGFGSTGG